MVASLHGNDIQPLPHSIESVLALTHGLDSFYKIVKLAGDLKECSGVGWPGLMLLACAGQPAADGAAAAQHCWCPASCREGHGRPGGGQPVSSNPISPGTAPTAARSRDCCQVFLISSEGATAIVNCISRRRSASSLRSRAHSKF